MIGQGHVTSLASFRLGIQYDSSLILRVSNVSYIVHDVGTRDHILAAFLLHFQGVELR